MMLNSCEIDYSGPRRISYANDNRIEAPKPPEKSSLERLQEFLNTPEKPQSLVIFEDFLTELCMDNQNPVHFEKLTRVLQNRENFPKIFTLYQKHQTRIPRLLRTIEKLSLAKGTDLEFELRAVNQRQDWRDRQKRRPVQEIVHSIEGPDTSYEDMLDSIRAAISSPDITDLPQVENNRKIALPIANDNKEVTKSSRKTSAPQQSVEYAPDNPTLKSMVKSVGLAVGFYASLFLGGEHLHKKYTEPAKKSVVENFVEKAQQKIAWYFPQRNADGIPISTQ